MTCIVAISDGETTSVVGCDTLAGQGDHSVQLPTKLVEGQHAVISACGWAKIITEMQSHFIFPDKDGLSNEEYLLKRLIPRTRQFLEWGGFLGFPDVIERETIKDRMKKLFKRPFEPRKMSTSSGHLYIKGNSQLMIVCGPQIVILNSDLTITRRSEGFDAIGSGRDYALGSLLTTSRSDMTPEKRAEWALRCAARYSQSCSAPFIIRRTE